MGAKVWVEDWVWGILELLSYSGIEISRQKKGFGHVWWQVFYGGFEHAEEFSSSLDVGFLGQRRGGAICNDKGNRCVEEEPVDYEKAVGDGVEILDFRLESFIDEQGDSMRALCAARV